MFFRVECLFIQERKANPSKIKGLRQHANDFDSNGSTDFNKLDDITNVSECK